MHFPILQIHMKSSRFCLSKNLMKRQKSYKWMWRTKADLIMVIAIFQSIINNAAKYFVISTILFGWDLFALLCLYVAHLRFCSNVLWIERVWRTKNLFTTVGGKCLTETSFSDHSGKMFNEYFYSPIWKMQIWLSIKFWIFSKS